jgi:hypothetical protein
MMGGGIRYSHKNFMEKTEENEKLILRHLWEMMRFEVLMVVKMSVVGFQGCGTVWTCRRVPAFLQNMVSWPRRPPLMLCE